MIIPGLVSISFRQLTAEEIIRMVGEAGLQGIEWGGDIHVPHGDLQRAAEVGDLTRQAGLQVAAYGSYYRVGCNPVHGRSDAAEGPTFETVLATAVKLGAPTIRVWAGNKGSADADDAWWERAVEDSLAIADMAAREGISISFEYHRNTLTDTAASASKLLRLCEHENINTLWQPSVDTNDEERLESLRIVSPRLSNLHVYHWNMLERCPLRSGERQWRAYLVHAASLSGDRYALLEFVLNDSVEQFMEDAKTLRELLAEVNPA